MEAKKAFKRIDGRYCSPAAYRWRVGTSSKSPSAMKPGRFERATGCGFGDLTPF
jgi:hypothetical protein